MLQFQDCILEKRDIAEEHEIRADRRCPSNALEDVATADPIRNRRYGAVQNTMPSSRQPAANMSAMSAVRGVRR